MKIYNISVQGTSPLLMNRPNQFDIAEKSKDVKRENRTPKELASDKLYIDGEENVYLPATWFQGAIVEAGKQKKMGGKGSAKATYSKVAGSCVEINPFEIFPKNAEWKVFSVLATNPTTRGKNMLHRPMFESWEVSFEVSFDENQIEPAVMKELFDIAGRMVGVGDWRPAKKGRFGKFQVTNWKEAR